MYIFFGIVISLAAIAAISTFIAFKSSQRWERSMRTTWFMVERKLAEMWFKLAKNFVSQERKEQMVAKLRADTATKAFTTFGNMKGVMMKMAQIMSFVNDQMPEEVQAEMRKLQNAAPPMDWPLIKDVIVRELGDDPWMVFKHFEEVPMAAASIGQVHKAQLPDGRWVAVKVQYPGVDKLIESDLKNIGMMFKLGARGFPGNFDPDAMAEEMSARIREELDYLNEARNQNDFRELFDGHEYIRIPQVIDEYTTKRVFVSEFRDGQDFYDFCKLDTHSELNTESALKLQKFVSVSIYRHGIFNADPHPGNYLFHDNGEVTFLDFGCVKRWDRKTVRQFRRFMRGLINDDRQAMVDALKELGVAKDAPVEAYDAFLTLWMEGSPQLLRDEVITLDSSLFPEMGEQPPKEAFEGISAPADLFYLFRVFVGLASIIIRLRARCNFQQLELENLDIADQFDEFVGDRVPDDQPVPVELAREFAEHLAEKQAL